MGVIERKSEEDEMFLEIAKSLIISEVPQEHVRAY